MTLRVVQWATGAVGMAQLRAVIASPALELAGLFVYSAEKAGQDAGVLAGCGETGILATTDKREILALDADLVLHAASKGFAENTNTDDIVALLESGKSVISTTTYAHLPTFSPEADRRIRAACDKAGTRFHAAGEHPGFMLERLAVSLTALSQRVDCITVQEVVDVSGLREHAMLVSLMGMGKQPHEVSPASPMFAAVSSQYEQAIMAAAESLHLTVDGIERSIRTATVDHDTKVACGVLPAGTVVGQILSWSATHSDKPVIVLEEYWTAASDIADWPEMPDGKFVVKVRIEGSPPMSLDLAIDNAPDAHGSGGGHIAVAMSAVRAIPDVMASPPGVVVPRVFGAYRWEQTQ